MRDDGEMQGSGLRDAGGWEKDARDMQGKREMQGRAREMPGRCGEDVTDM